MAVIEVDEYHQYLRAWHEPPRKWRYSLRGTVKVDYRIFAKYSLSILREVRKVEKTSKKARDAALVKVLVIPYIWIEDQNFATISMRFEFSDGFMIQHYWLHNDTISFMEHGEVPKEHRITLTQDSL